MALNTPQRSARPAASLLAAAWWLVLGMAVCAIASLHVLTYAQAYPGSQLAAWSHLTDPRAAQEYLGTLRVAAPCVGAASWLGALLLVGLARQRAALSERQQVCASGVPLLALTLWLVSKLVLTPGWSGVQRPLHIEQADALSLHLATARLDQPWILVGAFLAALALGWGYWKARTRNERVLLLALLVWVVSRGTADGLDYAASWRAARAALGADAYHGLSVAAGWLVLVSDILLFRVGGLAWRDVARAKAGGWLTCPL